MATLLFRFGVTPNIRFGERIVVNTWDKVTSRWRVVTQSGLQLTANIIISGSGALHVPKIPEFPGAETFRGEAFHTAQWRKVTAVMSVDNDGTCLVIGL